MAPVPARSVPRVRLRMIFVIALLAALAPTLVGCYYGHRRTYSRPNATTTAYSTTSRPAEPAPQQQNLPMLYKQEVLEMTFAGVAAGTIIAHVRGSHVAFELNTATIMELHENQVDNTVIDALIARRKAQAQSTPTAHPNPAPSNATASTTHVTEYRTYYQPAPRVHLGWGWGHRHCYPRSHFVIGWGW